MDRPYTGPTGITLKDGAFHIEGYPDAASVVKLSGPVGKRRPDLRLHHSDLAFCERTLQLFGDAIGSGPNDTSDGLWLAILTKFYACLGDSKARAALDATKVYRGNANASEVFKFFRHMRIEHSVRNENDYSCAVREIVLGLNYEVQDILALKNDFGHSDRFNAQNIYNKYIQPCRFGPKIRR